MITISDIQQYRNLELLARKAVEGFITGMHKSPYNGFSVEFAEHKQYNFGDSIKNVDWKVFARTEKLYIKNYEEETNLRCRILVDISPSMYYPKESKGKLTFSLFAASAISTLLQQQRDAFGITLFNNSIVYSSPIKSTKTHLNNQIGVFNKYLDETTYSKDCGTSISDTLHQIATTINKRSLIILFSDMFESNGKNTEDIFNALQHLKHEKHEIIIFHTLDHQHELDFDFENRPYEFIDNETGESIKLNPSQYQSTYQEKITSFNKEIKLRCAQYKIDFIEVNINEGIYGILTSYLIKRQKMR